MPRVKQFAVDDVLTRAIDRFSSHGYHATSISDLVDCMGIGRGSLYDTFGSKRGLFVRALRFSIDSYDRSFQEILDQSPAPARAIIGVFQDAAANGCFIVNAGIELASHDADITRIVTAFYRTAEHRFRVLIEQGQRAGEFAASLDPLHTAHLLFGLLLGLWTLVRSGASGEPMLRAAVHQVLALAPALQPGDREHEGSQAASCYPLDSLRSIERRNGPMRETDQR